MDKKRSQNFSFLEKAIFVDLLKELVNDVENSSKDSRSQLKRKSAWRSIMFAFNSKAEVTKRDEAQLCTLWRKIKRDAKKDYSRFRRESARTGGGPAPEPTSSITEDVKAMLPSVFKPVADVFDDDSVMDGTTCDEDAESQTPAKPDTSEEGGSGSSPDITPQAY